ncbi:MAG: DNA polymerase/3'-5' exonuclease PolX [Candidatus Micrarchaeota archaeon]|nr:DNA polymerase/3'-5' exonuclease PolX [Candidatus Micrarchaeota archaeon]
MINSTLAEMFDEIADMLELEGEKYSRFEVLAYRKAAITIGGLQEDAAEIYKKGGTDALMELPGIGKSMAGHIEEYVKTGKIAKYEKLKKKYPLDITNLTKIQGMGAKKAFKLYKSLGVKDVQGLKKALAQHKIRDLEGFGEQSEAQIQKGIEFMESSGGRMLLGTALPEAEAISDKLLKSNLVEKAIIGGSTRRMRETVGDLDILLISSRGQKVMDFITSMQEVDSVIAKGPTKTSVRLKIGLNCDFRLVERTSFGAALQYFTGNKDHNVKLREIAIKKGLKLNEYGLFDRKNKNVAAGEDEEQVYKTLGLDWMEPEMRENRGEIDLALHHKLPKLVRLDDIRGDLHVHSKHSGDSSNSFEDIAAEAKRLGKGYVGVTDHSKSEYMNRGLDEKGYMKVFDEIDKANRRLDGFRLLKSGEVDILKDGSLDINKKTLDEMDYVLASVHSGLKDPKEKMTKRIVDALNSGQIDILGHPTGRLINEREPIQADMDKVFEAAKDNGVVMEINAQPSRLDLNDENAMKAKKYGLKFSIDSDAHRISHFKYMRYGVGVAKRAWLSKEDVINTMGVDALLKLFSR